MKSMFLKLRSNIVLNGDVDLAEREVKCFFKQVKRVTNDGEIEKKLGLLTNHVNDNTRKGECIGFIVSKANTDFINLIKLLNFIQEIWGKSSDLDNVILSDFSWAYELKIDGIDYFCALPLMTCGELLSQSKTDETNVDDVRRLVAFLAGDKAPVSKKFKPPSTGGTSTQHLHSLHKYKAKFFPRLVRSFLVEHLEKIPRNKNGEVILLDPFVGSGTALIEASLLGVKSTGVDIDKLSCAITEAKFSALNLPSKILIEQIDLVKKKLLTTKSTSNGYKFPKRISIKFDRWGTKDEQHEYEETISHWLKAINSVKNEECKKVLLICLSDALTRKFVIRMMGTGVGRFALEIAKTSLDTLMNSNFKALIHSSYVVKTLIDSYGLVPQSAEVINGSAVNLPHKSNSISVVITSPPYLPASSGREDYLIGKAISNIALNLMSDAEIEEAETKTVGSMKWSVDDAEGLPKSVYDLYNWLTNDELRSIKAKPTLAYYVSLKQALIENFRVLMSNGLAIYVIGKESVFYRFSDREVLYKVECDKIFIEIAKSCGFIIDEQINVELDKKNKNARPRSLDSYYESVFILRKP
jgi:DNA modification methylase